MKNYLLMTKTQPFAYILSVNIRQENFCNFEYGNERATKRNFANFSKVR